MSRCHNLLALGMFQVLKRFLIELQVLVQLVLELSQLHQVQLGEVQDVLLSLVGCHIGGGVGGK